MESSTVSEPASLLKIGAKLEKPKRKRKLPAKFRGSPIEETPKQFKTNPKKKLVLEKGKSGKKKSFEDQKKTQNVEENRENVEKELFTLIETEKKELLKKVSKRTASRKSTGETERTPVVKGGGSSPGSWASFNRTKTVTPPKDEDLPEFDPENFTPGYVPKTVKKGDDEYVIVVSGVPDTGLCGTYWGGMEGLPSRRRRATQHPSKVKITTNNIQPETSSNLKTTDEMNPFVDVEESSNLTTTDKMNAKMITPSVDVERPSNFITTDKIFAKIITPYVDAGNPSVVSTTPKTNAKIKRCSVDVENMSILNVKKAPVDAKKSSALKSKKSLKKQVSSSEDFNVEETLQLKKSSQLDVKAFLEWEPELESFPNDTNGTKSPQLEDFTESDSEHMSQYQELIEFESKGLEVRLPLELRDEASSPKFGDQKGEPEDFFNIGSSNQDVESTTSTKEVTTSEMKSMSCMTANTPLEIMVDCYAPRDNRRWINMGKECEGMAPDAVQYVRVLKPAYHLLSFLRMKGHSSKGISRTDKNTMVFVVMEGEVSVTIHTSQFYAKKGDSFYVPPKNSYNLVNETATEVELSLLQFQYAGPLPSTSQSDGPMSTANQPDGPQATTSQPDGPQATTSQSDGPLPTTSLYDGPLPKASHAKN